MDIYGSAMSHIQATTHSHTLQERVGRTQLLQYAGTQTSNPQALLGMGWLNTADRLVKKSSKYTCHWLQRGWGGPLPEHYALSYGFSSLYGKCLTNSLIQGKCMANSQSNMTLA